MGAKVAKVFAWSFHCTTEKQSLVVPAKFLGL
jgi:hypothetical protein